MAAWWTRRQATRTYRVRALVGQMGRGGVVTRESWPTPEEAQQVAEQGFDRPVIGVRVVNTGAIPVTVDKWEVDLGGFSFRPLGDAVIGPALPATIAGGASEDWFMPVDRMSSVVQVLRELNSEHRRVRLRVTFGDGSTAVTRSM